MILRTEADSAKGSAVELRTDYPTNELRRLARRSKDVRQSSWLLSLESNSTGSNQTLDHDDSGSNRSKIMNVIDSNILERDAGGKSLHTFPHPALALLIEHDLIRKPVSTFRDRALSCGARWHEPYGCSQDWRDTSPNCATWCVGSTQRDRKGLLIPRRAAPRRGFHRSS
jgi:hypothetical protein